MTRDLEDMLAYIDDVNIYSKRPTAASTDEELYQRHYNSFYAFSSAALKLTYDSAARNVVLVFLTPDFWAILSLAMVYTLIQSR